MRQRWTRCSAGGGRSALSGFRRQARFSGRDALDAGGASRSAAALGSLRRLGRGGLLFLIASSTLMASALSDASAQERPRRRRNVIRLDETTIEGRIQKPQAFYILQRSNLNFEGLELKRSFVPKIIESVEDAPF